MRRSRPREKSHACHHAEHLPAHVSVSLLTLSALPVLVIIRICDSSYQYVRAAYAAQRSKRNGRWYITSSTRYPLNPGLWMTRPFRSEAVCREDFTGPGVSWARSEIGALRFE